MYDKNGPDYMLNYEFPVSKAYGYSQIKLCKEWWDDKLSIEIIFWILKLLPLFLNELINFFLATVDGKITLPFDETKRLQSNTFRSAWIQFTNVGLM